MHRGGMWGLVVAGAMLACSFGSDGAVAGTILRHSSTSNMAAGDYDGDGRADVAWILPGGDLALYSPWLAFGGVVPGTNAYAVVAADVTPGGDGVHELVYLRQTDPNPANPQQIRYISVTAMSDNPYPSPPNGVALQSRLTAGDWNNDGNYGIVVTAPNSFAVWGSQELGAGPVWNAPGGAGALTGAWVAADLVAGRPGMEFVGFNQAGRAYIYNGGTSNSYTDTNADGVNEITAADVNAAVPGAEILVRANGTQLYQWNAATGYALLPGASPGVLGAGSLVAGLGGLDQWIVIGSAPTYALHRFQQPGTWFLVNTLAKDHKWQDFVAADFDGDGLDEIVAIKRDTGAPWYFDPQTMSRLQRITAFEPGAAVPVETGLQLWLDASDASTIVTGPGGGVQTWMDKSGNNFHATQVDPDKEPALHPTAMGGKPAVRFDGADDGLSIDDGLVVGRPYTVFTVDQLYGSAARTLQSRDPGVNWLTGKWGGANAHFANGFVYQGTAGVGTTVPAIGDAVGYATGSGYMLNGIDVTGDPAPTGSPGRLGLGSSGTYNEQGQADVAEVIVFNRALSFHERSQVGLYLREKYGQTGYTAYNVHLATKEWAFFGADPGEGLDFQGRFLYAVNVRGPGGIQIGDAAFTTDAGLVSAENEILNWTSPSYGPSPDDQTLQTVMQSIRWTQTGNGGLEQLTVTLPGLVPGRTYKLQMLMGDSGTTRHWAVDINGSRVVGDLQSAAMQGATNTQGAVLVHQFVATSPTMSIVFDGNPVTGGDRNPILNALTLEDLGVTGRMWTGTFTGADPGEGLDLKRPYQYAVNVGGPAVQVGNLWFTADTATPGFRINAEHAAQGWSPSDFGPSSADQALATVMSSIRWTDTTGGNGLPTRGEALSIDLEGIVPGQQYLLQLLFQEACCSRGFDVVLNGTLIADEFSPVEVTGGIDPGLGVVLSHQFHADSDVLHIVLDGYPANFADRNPILQGLLLAQVPEPSTWALLVLGGVAMAGAAIRRKRRQ